MAKVAPAESDAMVPNAGMSAAVSRQSACGEGHGEDAAQSAQAGRDHSAGTAGHGIITYHNVLCSAKHGWRTPAAEAPVRAAPRWEGAGGMMSQVARRTGAVVRNGVVWGAAWGTAGVGVVSALLLTGNAPPDATWLKALGLAARIGVVGGMAGMLFALATMLLYRGRRMREMSWVRFGLAGAVVSGLGMPLVLQLLNILSGDGPVAWHLLTDDIPLLAVLGGGAAAAWLWLAQREERREDAR